jgi:hypothetical protein
MTLRIDDNAMGGAATWLRARKRTVAGDRDHDLAGYEKIDGQLAPTVLPTEAEAFYAEALCDLSHIGMPFLVGSTYALRAYIGITRVEGRGFREQPKAKHAYCSGRCAAGYSITASMVSTHAHARNAYRATSSLTDGQHAISVNRTSIGSDMAENN